MHLAIIPDGNRRWAKGKGFHAWKGHEQAIENFRSITEFCRNDSRIDVLTVWCFSTENWKRDPKEIAELFRMLESYLAKEREGFIKEKTRFLHSGRRDRIPSSLSRLIQETEQETQHQSAFTLHLAVDYGGKDEILRAIERQHSVCHPEVHCDSSMILRGSTKGLAPQYDKEQCLEGRAKRSSNTQSGDIIHPHLDHPSLPDIDLIIRTSGEYRTSNFFLWQSTYAEWIFSEKFFPDFTVPDLQAALDTYTERQRRYGS